MSTGDPNSVPLAPWQPEDRPRPTRWVGPYLLTPFGWRRLDGWTVDRNPFDDNDCDEPDEPDERPRMPVTVRVVRFGSSWAVAAPRRGQGMRRRVGRR